MARLRKLWLSNPRKSHPNKVSSYQYGAQILKNVFGADEDVARLDLALVTAADDVEEYLINRPRHYGQMRYPAQALQDVARWAWTIPADRVIWTPEVEMELLKLASEEAKTYSPVIPLVQGQDQRIKLARIATAIAGRLFSTEDGVFLIVKTEHVHAAHRILCMAYDAPATAYGAWSKDARRNEQISPEGERATMETLQRFPGLPAALLHANIFTAQALQELCAIDRTEANSIISILSAANMVVKRTTGYAKTKALIEMLRSRSWTPRDRKPPPLPLSDVLNGTPGDEI